MKCYLILIILALCNIRTASAQDIDRASVNRLINQLKVTRNDTVRLRSLLEIGKFHIFKPGELKTDLDSGERYINRARQLSDSLHLMKWQHESQAMAIVIVMERGNEAEGHRLFSQAINEYRKTGDKEAEAFLRFHFGIWLATKGTYTAEVLDNFYKSAGLYRTLKKSVLEIKVLKEIASLHFDDGKTDLAESELLNVLSRYKAIHYPNLHYTYNLLSTVSRVKGDFNKGLMYALLSLESMKQSGDTLYAANFYADLARIYMEIGNNDKGIEWYKKALQKWQRDQRTIFAVFVASGYISGDLIRQNKPREALVLTLAVAKKLPPITIIQKACLAQNLACCYDALHNYTLAEKYFQQSLQLYVKSKMDFEVSQEAHREIGKFYLNRRDFDKSGQYLRQALLFNPQKLSASALKDIHLMLSRVDSAQGNYLSSMDHYKKHKQLNDSILDSRKTREIEELQIQYETEKKTKDLVLLNNKSKLQQNKLEQANMTQRYTFSGLILMLIILALLYNQYKLKNRSNRDLQHQQREITEKNYSLEQLLSEKEWLLKEIHHRVKNNLQIVISLLNTQSTYLDNDIAIAAIRESQHRMHSISLIHQKLYQSENMALINMSDYIKELAAYLKDSFNLAGNIRFHFELTPVELDINQAIPVGLILNEAITNAIKYAFNYKRKGIIQISFFQDHPEQVTLEVKDDGPGFPSDFNIDACKSLGMNLIKGLSTQLDGTFEISRKDDLTCLTVSFSHKFHADNEEDLIPELQKI